MPWTGLARATDPPSRRRALWLLPAGVWLALGYVVAGIISFILIITIPFGVASFRLAGLALFPLGKDIVSTESLADSAGQAAVVTMPTTPRG